METVFHLQGVSVWGKRFPVKKTNLWSLGYFSTLAKAEKEIRDYVGNSQHDGDDYTSSDYCFIITEWEIDNDDGQNIISRQTYLKDGSFYDRNYVDRDKVFRGRPEDKIRFKHGDIVDVYDNEQLLLSIVDAVPPSVKRVNFLRERAVKKGRLKEGEDLWMDYSDDTFMVYDLTGGGHSHVESVFVFPHKKPISKYMRRQLETAMATES